MSNTCLDYDKCANANGSCTRLGLEHSCGFFKQKKLTPKAGQYWRLKRSKLVAKILWANVDNGPFGGAVKIEAEWSRDGEMHKSMDTFLKQYEPAPTPQKPIDSSKESRYG